MATNNPKVVGNHRRGYLGHGTNGVGGQVVPVQLGWLAVTGKVGDTAFIQLSSIVTGDINMGVFFQSEAGVTVDYTLCNPGIACSPQPADQQSTMWNGAQVIPANDITPAKFNVFTAMRITFTSPGTVYVGVR
jgi:hypothetical protein